MLKVRAFRRIWTRQNCSLTRPTTLALTSAKRALQSVSELNRLARRQSGVLMNDSNEYILGLIKAHVWSGFYSEEDVYQMIEDVLDENADEDLLRAAVLPEFRRKRQAEATWPTTTDCDRLDDAFAELNDDGVIALHNT